MNELLNVLTLVNQLVGLLTKFGVTFQQVADMQAQARAEGRELNVDDLDVLLEGVQGSRDKLQQAIDEAKAQSGS